MSIAQVTAYPLVWPLGWERKSFRAHKSFQGATFTRGRQRLQHELELLKATDCILSTNVPLRLDGNPSGTFNIGSITDPGVAVYFTLRGRPLVMARDAYVGVTENITSLAIAVGHLRGLERHGGATMMERAFSGFAALPAPNTKRRCWDVLGLSSANVLVLLDHDDRVRAIEQAFRTKAKTAHPDVGGSHDLMSELNAARAEALQEAEPR